MRDLELVMPRVAGDLIGQERMGGGEFGQVAESDFYTFRDELERFQGEADVDSDDQEQDEGMEVDEQEALDVVGQGDEVEHKPKVEKKVVLTKGADLGQIVSSVLALRGKGDKVATVGHSKNKDLALSSAKKATGIDVRKGEAGLDKKANKGMNPTLVLNRETGLVAKKKTAVGADKDVVPVGKKDTLSKKGKVGAEVPVVMVQAKEGASLGNVNQKKGEGKTEKLSLKKEILSPKGQQVVPVKAGGQHKAVNVVEVRKGSVENMGSKVMGQEVKPEFGKVEVKPEGVVTDKVDVSVAEGNKEGKAGEHKLGEVKDDLEFEAVDELPVAAKKPAKGNSSSRGARTEMGRGVIDGAVMSAARSGGAVAERVEVRDSVNGGAQFGSAFKGIEGVKEEVGMQAAFDKGDMKFNVTEAGMKEAGGQIMSKGGTAVTIERPVTPERLQAQTREAVVRFGGSRQNGGGDSGFSGGRSGSDQRGDGSMERDLAQIFDVAGVRGQSKMDMTGEGNFEVQSSSKAAAMVEEVTRKMEQMRESANGWTKMPLDGGGSLHFKAHGDGLEVRLNVEDQEVRDALEGAWGQIQDNARELGVQLKNLG